jgi:hypothetical protein
LSIVKVSKPKYNDLLKEIRQLVEQARHKVIRNINTELLFTYWNVGRLIIEREIKDNIDEQSSRQLILELSKELTRQLGKGFSRSNLFSMRRFYQAYQTVQTVSGQFNPGPVQIVPEQAGKRKNLTVSGKSKSVRTVSGQSKTGLTVSDQLS